MRWYLPEIQGELDFFRATHNRGNIRGIGKPSAIYNNGLGPQPCDVLVGDVHIPTRLPFSSEKLLERNEFMAYLACVSPRETYLTCREVNKLLLSELQRQ